MKKLLFVCCFLIGCGSTDNVGSTEPDSSFMQPDSNLTESDSSNQDEVVLVQPEASNLELDSSSSTDAVLDHKTDSKCEHRDCGDDRECHHHDGCCSK